MQCFVVSDERGQPQAARDAIAALDAVTRDLALPTDHVASLAGLQSEKGFAEVPHALVLIPAFADAAPDIADIVAFAHEQGSHAFVVLLADDVAPGDYKRLVRTGTADWISWRDCRDELRELVTRLASTSVTGRAAKVVSFVPSKGGIGNTTLVVEVAAMLSGRRKRGTVRLAALDLNLQGGTLADALDVAARFDVGEILGRPERLDEQLIDIFTSRHGKSLDVFASPANRTGLEAVSPDTVFTFLDAIANRYDAILIDLPRPWMTWTDALLQGSDAIVLSSGDSVPALRKTAAILGHMDALALSNAKLAVAVNAVEADFLGRVARRDVIERPLGQRHTFTIRRDDKTAASALDLGRPLADVTPSSKAVKDIRRLADWVEAAIDLAQAARLKVPHGKAVA